MKEDFFSEILKNDMQELEPDPGIATRLGYVMQLKAGTIQPSENSFLMFFKSFFTLQYFGIKAGIVTTMLVFSLILQNIPDNGTIHLNSNVLIADSSQCDSVHSAYFDSLALVQ